MCELLGMSFNEPVSFSFSFRGFTGRGKNNPDGWGIALYPQGSRAVQLIKEPLKIGKSELAEFIREYRSFRSSIFLSHVRQATSEVSYANTHPFIRELNGREYAFAHNGVLRNYKSELSLGRFKPLGTTDSEYAFCHLLNTIEDIHPKWNDNSFLELEDAMKRINQYGTFNCLFSDGQYLFCYRDKTGHKGLCYTERKPPHDSSVRLKDENIEVNLQEHKGQNEVGIIVATDHLTNENWRDLPIGSLTVFSHGQKVFPTEELLNEKMLHTLAFLRNSPHREDVFKVANTIGVKLNKICKVLQPLMDQGYIRQDSRDQGEAFEPSATYYTVVDKRDEIDQMLKEDSMKTQIMAEELDFYAGEEDKVLACINCQIFYKDGVTFCRKCLNQVDELDTSIADIILTLNAKGYKTRFCCAGHGEYDLNKPYISFGVDVSRLDSPRNFEWERSGDNKTLRMIPYHKAMGITKKKMEQTISEETLKEYRMKNTEALRAWANNLPVTEIIN